jgi:hypothetical protein
MAMTLADFVQLAALLGLSFTTALSPNSWSRLWKVIVLVAFPAFAAALFLERLFPGAECSWVVVAMKFAAVAVVVGISGLIVSHLSGWTAAWRKEGAPCRIPN